jgi:transcriptional regulator with XRE-family HTH domain
MQKTSYGVWDELRIIRERTGWLSADLAKNTFVGDKPMSPGYLSDLENGKRWPNAKVTKALAVALKVPVSVLERPTHEKESVA